MVSIGILIPARMGSTRFPNKPYCDLDGMTMIERVVAGCGNKYPVHVCTDMAIPHALYSDLKFDNGTARVAFHNKDLNYDIVVNVQGDMPDIRPDMIESVISGLGEVATLHTTMKPELLADPNTVKMTLPVDFTRDAAEGYHHLGVYAYTRDTLASYCLLDKSKREEDLGLEQLRWIDNGVSINSTYVDFEGIEINTPADRDKWNEVRKSLG